MARSGAGAVLESLRTLMHLGAAGDLSDGQLLGRFADRRGGDEAAEAAFGVLVHRHGPMVLRVCRRALKDEHEAQDASQATFLVLARRAGSIRQRESVGPWLFGVAQRIAKRSRAANARRLRHEQRAGERIANRIEAGVSPLESEPWAELYEEIDRLPERYRTPIVLCDLEGLTHAQAAQRLDWPLRTVQSRLYRGRDRLRARLSRRGVTLSSSGFVSLLAVDRASAALPVAWARATAQAASIFTKAGPSAALAGGASASALTLTKGALRMMFWSKITGAVTLLSMGLAATGAGALALQERTETPEAPPNPAAVRTQAKAATAIIQEPEPAGSAIARPLPSDEDLRPLLREAAEAAVELAEARPFPESWALTTIAQAQAKIGDLDGARETFQKAVAEATGGGQTDASAWGLWRVAHFQADAGLDDDARETLRKALEAVPEVSGDLNGDHWNFHALTNVIATLARIGDREAAREALETARAYLEQILETSKIGNADLLLLPLFARAQAAVGDIEGAFQTVEEMAIAASPHALVQIAESTEHLDRETAGEILERIEGHLNEIGDASEKPSALIALAQAWARLGQFERAKGLAREIGEAPTRADDDLNDGKPYAMLLIAIQQRGAGDTEGAQAMLSKGYEIIRDSPQMRGTSGRLTQIAWEQVAVGDLVGALRTIEAMERGRRSETLAAIAMAQAMAGEHEDARASLRAAIEDAEFGLQDDRDPAPAGIPDDLKENIRVSAPFAKRMEIARLRAMAGEVEEAVEIARSIDQETWRSQSFQQITQARAAAGEVRESLRLALDLEAPKERRDALEGLAIGLQYRKALETAPAVLPEP
ncbi:hypothetical protein BH23PLA1_BH23PLA1_32970 [soil metagenome]